MVRDINKEKLFEAFGELLYLIAMADGVIQSDEHAKLQEILAGHPWGREIKWSFDYERKKQANLDYLYRKTVEAISRHGQEEDCHFILQAMSQLAEASAGIDSDEEALIQKVAHDIALKFEADLA